MNGVNVKNTLAAIRIAKRIAKVLEEESANRLVMELESRRTQPQQAGEVGEAEERGFTAGLNAGCRIAKFDVGEVDAAKLMVAIYGADEGSSQ